MKYLFIPMETSLYSTLKKGGTREGLYLSLLGSGAVFIYFRKLVCIFNPKKRVELVKVGIYPSWDQVQYLFIPLEAGLYSALKKGWNFVKGLYLSLLGSGAVFTGLYSALIKRWNGLKVC